jgi:hypothetical protein
MDDFFEWKGTHQAQDLETEEPAEPVPVTA